jgi:hypothetical protein
MRNLFALIASVGLIGCVGSVDPPSGEIDPGTNVGPNPTMADLTEAKRLFDQNVFPTLTAKCSGGACHSETAQGSTLTRFVATDASKGWETAINYTGLIGNFTTSAPILTRVEPAHKGVSYDQAEKDKIVAWLAKEVELRNGQPNEPVKPGGETLSQAADRVMSAFAGCMTLANFQTANMAQAWANLQSNQGQCRVCHTSGDGGFIANTSANIAFTVISSKKMYWLQYFTVDLTGGAAAAKVIPNKVSFTGVYNRQVPHAAHPTFQYPNNAGVTALQTFYDATVATLGSGCLPKTLENE